MSWMRSCTWPRGRCCRTGSSAILYELALHGLREHQPSPDGGPGSRGRPERRGDRQPERENHGKRWCSGLAGKKIKGRKRHIVTDTLGLLVGLMARSRYPGPRRRARGPQIDPSSLPPLRTSSTPAGPKPRAPLRTSAAGSSRSSSAQTPPRASSSCPDGVVERTFAWLNELGRNQSPPHRHGFLSPTSDSSQGTRKVLSIEFRVASYERMLSRRRRWNPKIMGQYGRRRDLQAARQGSAATMGEDRADDRGRAMIPAAIAAGLGELDTAR